MRDTRWDNLDSDSDLLVDVEPEPVARDWSNLSGLSAAERAVIEDIHTRKSSSLFNFDSLGGLTLTRRQRLNIVQFFVNLGPKFCELFDTNLTTWLFLHHGLKLFDCSRDVLAPLFVHEGTLLSLLLACEAEAEDPFAWGFGDEEGTLLDVFGSAVIALAAIGRFDVFRGYLERYLDVIIKQEDLMVGLRFEVVTGAMLMAPKLVNTEAIHEKLFQVHGRGNCVIKNCLIGRPVIASMKEARARLKSRVKEKSFCSHCDKDGAKNLCQRCFTVRYCGRSCQKKDWKQHKKLCVAARLKKRAWKLELTASRDAAVVSFD